MALPVGLPYFGVACLDTVFGIACLDTVFGIACLDTVFGISCLDTLFEFVFAKNFLGRSASASEVTRGRCYTASFRYIMGELGHVYCPNEMCFAEVEHAQDLVFNFRRPNYIVACACFWFLPHYSAFLPGCKLTH